MDIVLKIEGMTCGGCKASVERLLAAQPGVRSATVDLAAGRATVAAEDGVAAQALADAVEGAGYDARVEG
ncbi:MAG: heavy-metal-associated domain-containing protein [Aquamicrobium sp.]|uniref:heavy-metal-associated domain-containing protein n=1 Tax=Aquamicrobium sp. TaxID=1872579 RepID=UPI00349ED93C|nr:heavy-metal-associated domain-containing protein [Aquamicrobium sp.]MCO5157976.1 heavy-metal-associated domain-containing protein [Aquamicrobium sp.]